jgi:hypothetical protein
MGTRMFCAAVLGIVMVLPAGAADLKSIPRTLIKEPAYAGKPRYCLCVFGSDAKTRVWLVQDGTHVLYADLNGDGDLTTPGEKFVNPHGSYFTLSRIKDRDGTSYKDLIISTLGDGTFRMSLGQEGQRGQFVGHGKMDRPAWSDKADNAPIIHFNGPMTLERYGPILTVQRGSSQNLRHMLQLMLGTPGLGKGTFASYDEICSEKLGPVHADIVYIHNLPLAITTRQKIDLAHEG